MHITLKQLQRLLNEELVRGVPEFELREIARKFVNELRESLRKSVLMTRGPSSQQDQALPAIDESLDGLEDDLVELAEKYVWEFTKKT